MVASPVHTDMATAGLSSRATCSSAHPLCFFHVDFLRTCLVLWLASLLSAVSITCEPFLTLLGLPYLHLSRLHCFPKLLCPNTFQGDFCSSNGLTRSSRGLKPEVKVSSASWWPLRPVEGRVWSVQDLVPWLLEAVLCHGSSDHISSVCICQWIFPL